MRKIKPASVICLALIAQTLGPWSALSENRVAFFSGTSASTDFSLDTEIDIGRNSRASISFALDGSKAGSSLGIGGGSGIHWRLGHRERPWGLSITGGGALMGGRQDTVVAAAGFRAIGVGAWHHTPIARGLRLVSRFHHLSAWATGGAVSHEGFGADENVSLPSRTGASLQLRALTSSGLFASIQSSVTFGAQQSPSTSLGIGSAFYRRCSPPGTSPECAYPVGDDDRGHLTLQDPFESGHLHLFVFLSSQET